MKVGVDLIEIERVRRALDRYPNFRERCFTEAERAYCDSRPNGRALMGITAEGRASVYFDANAKDRIGTDIKGGSLGALGWTAKAYGQ